MAYSYSGSAYPDQYQIWDVHLVDQNIANLFTEINSMKFMAGEEADMERKQHELFSKATTRHLVLELLYCDNENGIMFWIGVTLKIPLHIERNRNDCGSIMLAQGT